MGTVSSTSGAAEALRIRSLGRVPYEAALSLQQELRDARLAGTAPDTILLLEHPDVVTLGRGARAENVHLADSELRAQGYDVFRTNRGGDVTWHGPGQLIGYPILDLRDHGADVHAYLRRLEGVLIDTLADFSIAAGRRDGYAGVWLDDRRKIASIGIGLRRLVTLHGFALNVCCDLDRFAAIVPCGLEGIQMVSMQSVLGRPVSLEEVELRTAEQLRKAFG